jgi:hypothetical protein
MLKRYCVLQCVTPFTKESNYSILVSPTHLSTSVPNLLYHFTGSCIMYFPLLFTNSWPKLDKVLPICIRFYHSSSFSVFKSRTKFAYNIIANKLGGKITQIKSNLRFTFFDSFCNNLLSRNVNNLTLLLFLLLQ